MRGGLYAVNATDAEWDERSGLTWSAFIWFSSFHTSGSTMLPNLRNELLEVIAVMFLAARSDVSQLRRCTSEANEHTYGHLRQILREFSVEQLIRLVDKVMLKTNAIFSSDLATSRDNSGKGYTATFGDFLRSLRSATAKMPPCGPVDVDLNGKAVSQLWPHVRSVISDVNEKMIPFLKLFGVTEGNGLSPFATDIETPEDLAKLVEAYFRRPKKDPRDQVGNSAAREEEEEEEDNDDDVEVLPNGAVDFVASFITDIATDTSAADTSTEPVEVDGASDDDGSSDEDSEAGSKADEGGGAAPVVAASDSPMGNLFDDGDATKTVLELRGMLESSDVPSLRRRAMKLMEMMHLGNSEKGSLLPDSKFKSLKGRWFGCKTSKPGDEQDTAVAGTVVRRNSLVVLNVKRGQRVTQERYRVLGFFSKTHNKWLVHLDHNEVPFVRNAKTYKIMAKMVRKDGNGKVVEVELEKNGQWGPKFVHSMKLVGDIVRVESELENVASIWGDK